MTSPDTASLISTIRAAETFLAERSPMIQKTVSRLTRRERELRAPYRPGVYPTADGQWMAALSYDGSEIWSGRTTDDRGEAFDEACRKMDDLVDSALELEESAREREEAICPHCNGSGEGMHDGSGCGACGGSGVPRSEREVDVDYFIDRARDERAEAK